MPVCKRSACRSGRRAHRPNLSCTRARSRSIRTLVLLSFIGIFTFVEEQDVPRHLVAGQSRPEEGLDVVLGGRGAVLAARRTGPRSRRGASSGTPTARASFTGSNAPRCTSISAGDDVGPRGLDHLGAPTGPEDEAVVVVGSDVAGAVEAVGVEALRTRALHVVLHQRRAPDEQLALLAGTEDRARFGIDHAQLVAGEETPGAAGTEHVARGGAGQAGEERCRLRHPVADRHVPPGVTLHRRVAGEDRLAEHLRARRQVGGRPVRVLIERTGLVAEHVRLGDPLTLDQSKRVGRLEPLLHHPGATGGDRGAHRRVHPGRPEERQWAPHARRGVAPEELCLHRPLQRDGAVAVHHALRGRRGAGAGDHDRVVGRVHLRRDRVEQRVVDGVASLEERIPALDAGGIVDRPDHRGVAEERERGRCDRVGTGRGGTQRGDVVREPAAGHGGLEQQDREVGVTDEVCQLGRRRERRDRHRDRAGERGTEQRGHGLGPVPHQDADAGALSEPAREQRRGHPPSLALELPVTPPDGGAGEQGVVEDERLVLGSASGPLGEDAAERERADARTRLPGRADERRWLPPGLRRGVRSDGPHQSDVTLR